MWPWRTKKRSSFYLVQLEFGFSLVAQPKLWTCSIDIVLLAVSSWSSEVFPEPCYTPCWWRPENRVEIEFLSLSNMGACQEPWISTYFLIVSWEWMAALITGDVFCCFGRKMREWQLGCVGGWCCSWQGTGNPQKSGKTKKIAT